MNDPFADAVERDGFAVAPAAVDAELVSALTRAVSNFRGGHRAQGVYRRGEVYALRNLFDLVPETRRTLDAPAVRESIVAVLGSEAFCVRAIFLDKSPRASSRTSWHQDATVVVKARAEVTGFGPWTRKAGAQHVMAPPGTLSSMLSLRIHLDACGESGATRVVPGSHAYGRLPADSIEQFTRYDVAACEVKKGEIVAMRPLLLRASGPTAPDGPRRVIQLDFCARRLPTPLEWRERLPLSGLGR
jgi:ectoine hydroxylase-related dioxygenase (phytanoyl-CoA dioxygenase family)